MSASVALPETGGTPALSAALDTADLLGARAMLALRAVPGPQ